MRHKLLLFTCSLIAILTAQILLYPPPLSAISDENTWSWTSEAPKVTAAKHNNEIPYDLCPYSYGTIEVTYLYNYKNACLFSSDKLRFGIYYENGRFVPVVGFGTDNYALELIGLVCYQQGSCIYNDKTDSLITRVSYGNSPATIVIYDHFISRITPYIDYFVPASLPTLRHRFDATNPKFVFSETTGYIRNIGGFGVSNNGRYVVAEIMHYGFVLIDTDGFKIRRISNFSAQYFMGSDPTIDLAVSNDGKTVVVAGINSGFQIITISDTCGDWPSEHSIIQRRPLAVQCEILPLSLYTYVNRFKHAFRPKFSDDGGEFTIYAVSDVEAYFLIISASGHEQKTMDYIAMGDSFSSGEGENLDILYKIGTNTPTEKCHLSLRSYPYLIARHMEIDPLRMASVACSGATTTDILGYDGYTGQGKRLKTYSPVGAAISKTEAFINFTPGNNPQIEFIAKYRPKIATIGIGGNDINLVTKLVNCISSIQCKWADANYRHITASEIHGLFQTLTNTYSKLIESSPQTKFYAIGYPKIMNQDNEDLIYDNFFNKQERQFANETIILINKTVAAAAKRAGIGFIDIEDSFGDHVLYGKDMPLAMNTLVIGDDKNPIFDNFIVKTIGSESFHPNPLGHQLISGAIISHVDNLFTYNFCPNNQITCPNKNILPPEPSDYWGVDKTDTKIYKAKDIADIKQKTIDIIIEDGSLASNQTANIEIHSNPIKIGVFNTNENGGLSLSFSIPESLEYGFHTLHVLSKTVSGEEIDIYQIFEHREYLPIEIESMPVNINESTTKTENKAQEYKVNSILADINNSGVVLGDKSQTYINPIIEKQSGYTTTAKVNTSINYNSIITIAAIVIIASILVYSFKRII